MIILSRCVDDWQYRLGLNLNNPAPIPIKTKLKHFLCDENHVFHLTAQQIKVIERAKTPIMINILSGKVIRRISDRNGGTWQFLQEFYDENSNRFAARWVKSDYSDDEYLTSEHAHLYQNLVF